MFGGNLKPWTSMLTDAAGGADVAAGAAGELQAVAIATAATSANALRDEVMPSS
jgi:hypothetical protein